MIHSPQFTFTFSVSAVVSLTEPNPYLKSISCTIPQNTKAAWVAFSSISLQPTPSDLFLNVIF